MHLKNVKIRRNGAFLNAWYFGQFFMVTIDLENPLESQKKLLSKVIQYHNTIAQ